METHSLMLFLTYTNIQAKLLRVTLWDNNIISTLNKLINRSLLSKCKTNRFSILINFIINFCKIVAVINLWQKLKTASRCNQMFRYKLIMRTMFAEINNKIYKNWESICFAFWYQRPHIEKRSASLFATKYGKNSLAADVQKIINILIPQNTVVQYL